MKKHTKIYLKGMGYAIGDYMPCEMRCGSPMADVNHISPRGMGGSKLKDFFENLIGMCRKCHNEFEAKKISKEELLEITKYR